VEVLDDPVVRPEGFDLAAAWNDTLSRLDRERATFEVEAAAQPEAVRWLRGAFDRRLAVGEARADGRVDVRIRSWSAHAAAGDLVGFAPWVEVLSPNEVRQELAERGAHLTRLYAERG
jgi:predicted DNA-binding transcriptional regulator YafY